MASPNDLLEPDLSVDTQPEQATSFPDPIIEVAGLTKHYGATTAVAGVDLTVRLNEIFGILGPNGAGKTTVLEMIEGLRAADGGTIRVAGYDPQREGKAVRQLIGVQLQTTALFDYLTAAELIALFARLYRADAGSARVDQLLAMVGLTEKRSARVEQLSGGQRQRLAIALALVNRPAVVFLDEPTTGLDPRARRALWETIREIRAEGTTVVLTTHYMEEAETLCDRVAIMDQGEVIACAPPATLVRQIGTRATISASVADGALPCHLLESLPGVEQARWDRDAAMLHLSTTDAQATLVGLLDLAERRGITLGGLRSRQPNLEDVFLSLTGRSYQSVDAASPEPEPPAGRRRRR